MCLALPALLIDLQDDFQATVDLAGDYAIGVVAAVQHVTHRAAVVRQAQIALLVAAADQALYQAKGLGRDRYVVNHNFINKLV